MTHRHVRRKALPTKLIDFRVPLQSRKSLILRSIRPLIDGTVHGRPVPHLPYSRIDNSKKMSRFFRGGDDSSSESSSEEEELYTDEEEEQLEDESEEESSEEEEEAEEESSEDEGETGAARFLKGVSSESDESDEEVRTKVKSAKDKRFDELEGIIRLIENAKKIDDWGTIAIGRHFQHLN